MTIAGILGDALLAALTAAIVVDCAITKKWLKTSRVELEYLRIAAASQVREGGRVVDLPTHCYSCGAYLMGGLTKHRPGCEIARLIEETFGHETNNGRDDR